MPEPRRAHLPPQDPLVDEINQLIEREIHTLSAAEERDWMRASAMPPTRVTLYKRGTQSAIGEAWIVARVENGPFYLGLDERLEAGGMIRVWNIYRRDGQYMNHYDGPWLTLFGAIEEVWFGLELKPLRSKAR